MSNAAGWVRGFLQLCEENPVPWFLSDEGTLEAHGLIVDANGQPVCRIVGDRDFEMTALMVTQAVNQVADLCRTLSVTDQQ